MQIAIMIQKNMINIKLFIVMVILLHAHIEGDLQHLHQE